MVWILEHPTPQLLEMILQVQSVTSMLLVSAIFGIVKWIGFASVIKDADFGVTIHQDKRFSLLVPVFTKV